MVTNFIFILTNFLKLLFFIPKSVYYFIRKPIKSNGMEFGLHGVFASFGQGKTLTMCKLALNRKKIVEANGNECLIFSNMSTTFSTKLVDIMDIVSIANEQSELLRQGKNRQVIILLDEIQTLFNSRAYQSLPIEVIAVLCGNRHLNISLYYTVQASFAVDKYFRELSNDFYYARKINTYLFSYFLVRDRKSLEVMEEWCKIPPLLYSHKYFLVNPFDSDNLFNCYNTKEDMQDIMLQQGNNSNKDLFRKTSETFSTDLETRKKVYKKLYK